MKIYLLEQDTIIKAPPEQVWKFFSDAGNLQLITPAYMNFTVTRRPETDELYTGMQIEYKVSPVLHISLKWVTLIQSVERLKSFTDKQLKGPYALWEHTHTFDPVPQGTLMRDRVRYALPFGIFGRFAHALFVRRKLRSIFSFREKVIKKLFG